MTRRKPAPNKLVLRVIVSVRVSDWATWNECFAAIEQCWTARNILRTHAHISAYYFTYNVGGVLFCINQFVTVKYFTSRLTHRQSIARRDHISALSFIYICKRPTRIPRKNTTLRTLSKITIFIQSQQCETVRLVRLKFITSNERMTQQRNNNNNNINYYYTVHIIMLW